MALIRKGDLPEIFEGLIDQNLISCVIETKIGEEIAFRNLSC